MPDATALAEAGLEKPLRFQQGDNMLWLDLMQRQESCTMSLINVSAWLLGGDAGRACLAPLLEQLLDRVMHAAEGLDNYDSPQQLTQLSVYACGCRYTILMHQTA